MVQTAKQLLNLKAIMVGITEKTFADMALLAYKSGGVVPILSGEEVTVSGVKSTVCMLFCIFLFSTWLAARKGRHAAARQALENLAQIPNAIEGILEDKDLKERSRKLARCYSNCQAVVFIDAQQCSGAGREVALKLEENGWSTIGKTLDYSEAAPFAGKELPLDILVIVNATCKRRLDEAIGIMERLRHRGTHFLSISIAHRQQALIDTYAAERSIYLPRLPEELQTFVDLVFYYQFAFYFGLAQGREIGIPPRNRAKSLTVSRNLEVNYRQPAERLLLIKEANQAHSTVEKVVERAAKRSHWEAQAASDIERRYYRSMRRLAKSIVCPSPSFSRLEGLDAQTAERLSDTLFSDASDVEEIIFVTLDRIADAAARAVVNQWRLLIDAPFRVLNPWESAAHLPEGALLIVTAGSHSSTKVLDQVLTNADCPFVYVGPEPADASFAESKSCIGCFSVATDSSLYDFDLLYARFNELFVKFWQLVAPDKAAVVERHVSMGAQVILEVLNNADLLDDIRGAMRNNSTYTTAFFIGPPNGIGLAWLECFDRFSPVILEHHPFGHSAHGPLVTVDPRVEQKFVKLEPRDNMTARYGKSKVLEWEETFLDGKPVDAFLSQHMPSAPRDWRQPFLSEESWYLPVLHPAYQTVEDNLIIMDTTSNLYFHQAVDELATFGCRYPRMVVLSQATSVTGLRAAGVFRFPISNLILLPGIPYQYKRHPISEFHLPHCLNLVALAMARATQQPI
jgi:hypothetical protein